MKVVSGRRPRNPDGIHIIYRMLKTLANTGFSRLAQHL
jgi:hypothetical protein